MKKLTIAMATVAMAAFPAAAQEAPRTPAAPAQGQSSRPQTQAGRLIFFNQPNYNGEDYEIDSLKRTFRWDYNIRSIAIHPGDRWELCAQPRFSGCIVLDRSVPDATMVGITASIGSLRPAPAAAAR